MVSDGIFLETSEGLRLMTEQPYEKEDVLQRALEDYPEVIAGVTTSTEGQVKLALVRREAPVPDQEGGSQMWSLDHLFLDANAVPVFVEVKRSSDTRIRREVIGQMLDYAANGSRYWPLAELRAAFDERLAQGQHSPEEWLAEHFGAEDPEVFWQQVETNLRAGKIRLVFVADALPKELVRIIEFLNEQMSSAEVLGVELRQYVSDGHRAFVPTVVGRTDEAVDIKSLGARGQQWTEATFLGTARQRRTPVEVRFIERLFQHVVDLGGLMRWGKGATPGMSGWYPLAGTQRPVFNLNVNADAPGRQAYLSFYLADLKRHLDTQVLEEALSTLEGIAAFRQTVADARAADYVKWPTAFLPSFTESDHDVAALLRTIETIVGGGQSRS